MSKESLVIYGKDNCYWCKEAVSTAHRYSIQFEYKNIGDLKNKNEMFDRAPDAKTVPQIFWHGKYIGGYKEFASEVENTLGGNFGQDLF